MQASQFMHRGEKPHWSNSKALHRASRDAYSAHCVLENIREGRQGLVLVAVTRNANNENDEHNKNRNSNDLLQWDFGVFGLEMIHGLSRTQCTSATRIGFACLRPWRRHDMPAKSEPQNPEP